MDREPDAVDGPRAAEGWRVAVAGGAVMAVSFGMARYAYGLTLPALRAALAPSEFVLGLIGGGTFAGFLISLLAAPWLAGWKGPRAPTTVGALSATAGCATVASAGSPGQLAVGALVAGSAAGWVWASYSTIAAAITPAARLPRLLGAIATGAAGGLVVVGALGLVVGSWRWIWGGISFLAAGAATANLWLVPKLPPGPRAARSPATSVRAPIVPPVVFAIVLFLGATVYFTYATDAADRGGLGAAAGPLIFMLVGASGLSGLVAGRLAERAGVHSIAVTALVLLTSALVVLAFRADSLLAVLLSAAVFGSANTVGSAALPIWTAALAPDRAAEAFTSTLLAGAASATLTPVVAGTVIPLVGLRDVLLGAAIVCATAAVALRLAPSRRPGV